MEIEELVEKVNLKLSEGLTVAKAEKELGFGKDSIRQRLKRNGYSYNKALKCFEVQENIIGAKDSTHKNTVYLKNVAQESTDSYKKTESAYNNPIIENIGGKKMTLDEFKKLSTVEQVNLVNQYTQEKLTLKEIEKKYFDFTNIGKYINREHAYWDGAKKKFILIENGLTKEEIMFIKNLYKQSKLSSEVNELELDKDNIKHTSIRVDANVFNEFTECCKKNKLKQINAITIAMSDFIKKMEGK